MSHLDPVLALVITVAVVVLSAFFVAIEFALVAARGHRLAEAARTSVSARAALRSARDLSMLLAGSQLGITLCTLVLGAVTKPTVHHLMLPAIRMWGLPEATADVAAFVLSLIAVTFVHLVVGEMAPKSWAIAHPERSAILLAVPMRGFMWLTRPALVALNGLANRCLRAVGVQAVDELDTGHTPEDLRQLLDHSSKVGALDERRHEQLATALDLHTRPVREIVRPRSELVTVAPWQGAEGVRAAVRSSGHLRLVVWGDEPLGRPLGVVHVRDALTAPDGTTAAQLMRPLLTLPDDTPMHAALTTIRDRRNHLVLVYSGGELSGFVTLHDLLDQLLPAAHQ
ncbi:hemolysin family protein [Actinophytocola sp.]|uniref:hemolysin family protein n=1 Tax=Actinophytocola sp. TaxID=1872138 RepID=UPI003D6A18D7